MHTKFEIIRIDSAITKIGSLDNIGDVIRFVKTNTNKHVKYKIIMAETNRSDVTSDIHRLINDR